MLKGIYYQLLLATADRQLIYGDRLGLTNKFRVNHKNIRKAKIKNKLKK